MVHHSSAKHQQQRLLIFIVILVILVCVGIAQTVAHSFAKAALDVRDPLSTGHDLFDPQEFIRLRRESRAVHLNEGIDGIPTPVSSSAFSVGSSMASSGLSEIVAPLTFDALSQYEQQTLRNQLRSGGCPQEADVRYLALCESMLKELTLPSPRAGLANPNQ
jgi:hypothetical protein